MAILEFDANEVEPAEEFVLLPAGEYLACIIESDMEDNKAATGSFLKLTFQIIEGEHKNRNLWARLNLNNPNAMTVRIAKAELSAICRAVGVMTPQDSCELHDKPLVIKVTQVKRKDTGEPTNEIKAYKSTAPDTEPAQTSEPTTQSPSPAQAPQVNDGTPPWKRK